MGTKILTSLQQNNAINIFYHNHGCWYHIRIIKDPSHDHLLADWFTKYLFPLISRDVAMVGVVIEEKYIHSSQPLDLSYS